jgi:hypothetical protein
MLADRDSELSSASRAAVAALRPSSSRRGEAALRLRRHRGEMGAAKTKDGATLPSVSLASGPCHVLCARRWCRVRRVGKKWRERESGGMVQREKAAGFLCPPIEKLLAAVRFCVF